MSEQPILTEAETLILREYIDCGPDIEIIGFTNSADIAICLGLAKNGLLESRGHSGLMGALFAITDAGRQALGEGAE